MNVLLPQRFEGVVLVGGDDKLRVRRVLGAAAGRRGGLTAQVPAAAAALHAHQASYGKTVTSTVPLGTSSLILFNFSKA